MRVQKTEAAELRAPRLDVLVRKFLVVQRLEVLDWRLVVRELVRGVLRVLGELQADVARDRALARLQRARDQVQQRRLARPVLPDDRDARVHAAGTRAGADAEMDGSGNTGKLERDRSGTGTARM